MASLKNSAEREEYKRKKNLAIDVQFGGPTGKIEPIHIIRPDRKSTK
jgi:hypothetical protein